MSHLARAKEVFDIELAALKTVRAHLDGAFDAAVNFVMETLRQRGKSSSLGSVNREISATKSQPP